jgi:hypothetical protein
MGQSTATVTGHLIYPSAGPPTNAQVCMSLQNYKPNVPRIIGSGTIVSQTNWCISVSTVDGSFSVPLIRNDFIAPNGTFWHISYVWDNIQQSGADWLITSTPFNLDTQTPLSSTIPLGPATILTQSFLCSIPVASLTWVCTHNLNDPYVVVGDPYNSSNVRIFPDTLTRTDANTVTITWLSPQAGSTTIIHAGSLNIATNQPNAVITNPSSSQTVSQPFTTTGLDTAAGGFTSSGPTQLNGTTTAANPIVGSITGNAGTATIANGTTGISTLLCKSFENITCVDAANSQGWAGSDYGAWFNAAVAAANGGEVILAPSSTPVNVSTTMSVTAPVHIHGPGKAALKINCTMNADCMNVHMSPFTIYLTGTEIEGFSLIGQGTANANAVGVHWGDILDARFDDIGIDNFRGANSACSWGDNINGFSERNLFTHIDTGLAPGEQNGCTKDWKWTNTSNTALSSSFAHNHYAFNKYSIFDGQTAFSFEGGNHNGLSAFDFTGNISTGTTAIVGSVSGLTYTGGSSTFLDGNINVTAECTPPCSAGTLLKTVGAQNNVFIRSGVGFLDISGLLTTSFTGSVVRVLNDTFNGANAESVWIMGQSFSGPSNPYIFNPANPAASRQIAIRDPLGPAALAMHLNAATGLYQSKRGTSGCTTAAAIGGICATPITVTWTTSFPDTNYSAGCSAEGTPSNSPSPPYVATKANGSITVNYMAITAVAAAWPSVDCWAVHD